MSRKGFWIAVLVLVLLGGGYKWRHRAVAVPVGVRAVAEPVQVPTAVAPFDFKGFKITPLADYTITARVLRTEGYYTGREAELSPIDFALGWGVMSDTAVIDALNITQGGRWYRYSWSGEPPVPVDEIVQHSANTHIIPADKTVERQIDKVRQNQTITMHGYLIRAEAGDGWHWESSLTRADSGDGACEVFFVTAVQ